MNIKTGLLVLMLSFFSFSTGWTLPNPSYFPNGWSLNRGTPKGIKMEYKVLADSGAHEGDTYAFVRGHLMSEQFSVSAGDELEISFYARDPEGNEVSCMLYTYSFQEGGTLRYSGTITGFSQKAPPQWTEVTGTIKIPGLVEDEERFVKGKNPADAVIVVLASNTGAYFDYPSIVHIKTGTWNNAECARHEGRGRLKLSQGNYRGAIEEFNEALAIVETTGEKNLILARIEETERTEKIEATWKKTENIFPLIDDLVKQGRYENARKEYEKIRKLSENDYLKELSLFNIAELYRLEKDYRNAHSAYRSIFSIPGLTPYYRIYGLFRQAEVYSEQRDYGRARGLYGQVLKTREALDSHVFKAKLFSADTYRAEQKYKQARALYEKLLAEQESSIFPHESYRADIAERLESIDGLADGTKEKSMQEKLVERINSPRYAIYVSPSGSDNNSGTKESPFATIKRAQEEVRKIKAKGLPPGGIAVYMRGGKYFLPESISFEKEDSGTEGSPMVYRSFPGEEVRLIGGKQLTNFKPLANPEILKRLPEEARGKIWVSDLKEAGITDYGKLLNRGHSGGPLQPAALELFCNAEPMKLARWPKEGWKRTLLINPEGDMKIRNMAVHKGRFKYNYDRPERWKEEKDIWAVGYFLWEWDRIHASVSSIDTEKKAVSLDQDRRHHPTYPSYNMPVKNDTPYYFYNILGELSTPGEFYVDREAGKLYFYPPGRIEGSEIIASTLDSPIINLNESSNTILFNLTIEVTRRNGLEINGGSNNLVAGSIIRNTGDLGIVVEGGWNNIITGCDIYETGEGGIRLRGEGWDRTKADAILLPGGHIIENNHIYRYNRFSFGGGGGMGISLSGTSNRIRSNLLHDGPYICMMFDGNDNIMEYNEIYDVMNEGRDGGAIYTYGEPRYLLNRGNVLRYNFLHHLTEQSSPIKTHQVTGIYVDALNGGVTKLGNIFYMCTERSMFAHGPDNRIENNFFVDNNAGITMHDRSWILDATKIDTSLPPWAERLKLSRGKQPPWSNRYPQLAKILEDTLPLGRIENNCIERNISIGTPFLTGVLQPAKNTIRNNWEAKNPLFMDKKGMDFRLRPGSPVFGITGADPVPFEKIGVYESPLRASWPVKRAPSGKYIKDEK